MARSLGFDASYISRIMSGKRKPANVEEFVNSICTYLVKHHSKLEDKSIIINELKVDYTEIENSDDYYLCLQRYIFSNTTLEEYSPSSFLKKLDEFNLDDYIKAVHFDTLRVPSIPFYHTPNKNYYGLDEMKNGELDFFKSTILSKTKEPIFMYNDMPMEDMSKDLDFGKKWMFAIACSLKKGLHLNVIHNLDRPFNELMLGLESWIPMYMTGQISPYYFKTPTNEIFYHTLYVSEVSALSGDGIANNHSKSKYYLTNKNKELEFYQEKAKQLLKKASPLMKIYNQNNKNEFELFLKSEKEFKDNKIYEIKNKNLNNTFKNIKFTICENKWIMVSKNKHPEIHFVIYHPTLRDSILNFVAPVKEGKRDGS